MRLQFSASHSRTQLEHIIKNNFYNFVVDAPHMYILLLNRLLSARAFILFVFRFRLARTLSCVFFSWFSGFWVLGSVSTLRCDRCKWKT